MKFYEICFSPTGGTKKAADILSNELSSEIHPIDLTDSKQDFSDISLSDDDTAVIAVPSYGGRVPEPASQPPCFYKWKRSESRSCMCIWKPRI